MLEVNRLGEQIKNKLKAEDMSVPELATILEVPKDRIYKWRKGSKPSDMEDYIKVTRWLESVPSGKQNVIRQDHKKNMIHPYTLSDKRLKSTEPGKNQQEEKLTETVLNLSEAILRLMDENAELKANKNEKR